MISDVGTHPSIRGCAYSENTTSCVVAISNTLSKVKALSFPSTTWGSPGVTDVHTLQLSIFSLGSWGLILQAERQGLQKLIHFLIDEVETWMTGLNLYGNFGKTPKQIMI